MATALATKTKLIGKLLSRGICNGNCYVVVNSFHRNLVNKLVAPANHVNSIIVWRNDFHTTGPSLLTTATNKRKEVPGQVTCDKCSHVYSSSGGEDVDFTKLVTCPKCGALQRIQHDQLPNYFEMLGEQKGYRVNVQGMSNKSKQLQKKFHPDLYSQKGSEQQDLSQVYSSLINKALSTLSDPISRGRYLLSLSGMSLNDLESDLEKSITNDPEFLEEVMELNERLIEISSEKDWKEFRNQNVETMKQIHLKLENVFENNDIKQAHRLLGRLKYFDTLQHKLKELQSRIGIVE